MSEEKLKGIRGAARWYTGRFLGLKSAGEMASRHVADGYQTGRDAFDALRPKGRLTRRSFFNRYPDGGIERFRELSSGMSAEEIDRALRAWERDRAIYLISGAMGMLTIPASLHFGYRSTFMLAGIALLALTAFVLSIKSGFRAWQIRQGRLGSVADYLRGGLPANMQILNRDDDP
jgi:hypothetical protein